jgi:hypothetical protein
MSIVDVAYRTFTCEGPNCSNTVTFEQSREKGIDQVLESHPWVKTATLVQQVVTGQTFVLCSDKCRLDAIEADFFTPQERKSILVPEGANTLAAAAANAKAAEDATKALKAGRGLQFKG